MTTEQSIAAQEVKAGERQSTREQRGLSLYLDRGEEITYYPVQDEYAVPSATAGGEHYIVRLQDSKCECPDSKYHGQGEACKHQFAATIWAAKHRNALPFKAGGPKHRRSRCDRRAA